MYYNRSDKRHAVKDKLGRQQLPVAEHVCLHRWNRHPRPQTFSNLVFLIYYKLVNATSVQTDYLGL